jgi:hypothetical protein
LILLGILGVTWTVLAIKWFGNIGNPYVYEKAGWERQEA